MSAHRTREPRQPVRIGARLKSGRGWSDIVLRNVSARGVMGQCPAPPARGDYVEMRCGAYVIVARVAWARDDRFGARAQDPIALAGLIACAEGRARQAEERRRHVRAEPPVRHRPTLADRGFASRHLGRVFELGSLVLAGAALATLLGGAAHDALARPAAHISQAMTAGEPR
jgi:hypothetical protein